MASADKRNKLRNNMITEVSVALVTEIYRARDQSVRSIRDEAYRRNRTTELHVIVDNACLMSGVTTLRIPTHGDYESAETQTHLKAESEYTLATQYTCNSTQPKRWSTTVEELAAICKGFLSCFLFLLRCLYFLAVDVWHAFDTASLHAEECQCEAKVPVRHQIGR